MNTVEKNPVGNLVRAILTPELALAALAAVVFSFTITHPENILPEDLIPGKSTGQNPVLFSPDVIAEAMELPPGKLLADGEKESAVKKAYELSDKRPHDVLVAVCAGNVLVEVGQLDRGFRLLKRSVALAPTSRYIRMNLAGHLSDKERYEESLSQYKLVTEAYPHWPKPRLAVAEIYMKTNNPALAAEELKIALDAEPNNFKARRQRGIALGRSGKAARGLEEYFIGDSTELQLQGYPEDVRMMRKNWGTLDRALFEFQKELEMRPDDPNVKLRLARIYMYSGQPADAKKLLMEARKKAPKNFEIHRSLALVLKKLGEESQALSEFILSVKCELDREKQLREGR